MLWFYKSLQEALWKATKEMKRLEKRGKGEARIEVANAKFHVLSPHPQQTLLVSHVTVPFDLNCLKILFNVR